MDDAVPFAPIVQKLGQNIVFTGAAILETDTFLAVRGEANLFPNKHSSTFVSTPAQLLWLNTNIGSVSHRGGKVLSYTAARCQQHQMVFTTPSICHYFPAYSEILYTRIPMIPEGHVAMKVQVGSVI